MNASQLEPLVRTLEANVGGVDRQLDVMRRQNERLTDQVSRLQSQLDKTEQKLADHIGQVEKWDARRWTLITLLVGAVLSLASGLIVTLARK